MGIPTDRSGKFGQSWKVMNRESLVSHVKHRRNEGAGSKHQKKQVKNVSSKWEKSAQKQTSIQNC